MLYTNSKPTLSCCHSTNVSSIFSFTAKRFLETGDPSLIWEGHKAGRDIGYCHMEKLTNLESLPPFGFKVSCFPVKIEKASAGWTRCVALLDD